MPVPATIEVCEKYLFADVNEMAADGIPELIQQRLIRLRDMYNYWLQFPRKKDLEIVQELEYRYKISKSSAYDDVRIIKRLLGDLAKTTKDYHRYKFCQMIDETFEMARRIKDARAMGAAANYYGKYTQLDKEDILDKGYDKIIVQPFEPTVIRPCLASSLFLMSGIELNQRFNNIGLTILRMWTLKRLSSMKMISLILNRKNNETIL